MNFYEVGRDEAERLHPLADFDGIRCIMYEPEGGNVDPSGVTMAYAAGARKMGAEIHRFTPATATEAQADGSWIVRTPKGDIRAQWVVNAAGLWGREVAAMAGLQLPLIPTEHQYFVTETIPEIAAMGRRLPSVADRDGEYYLRQEGLGLLIGAYERNMKFWAEEGTPLDFGHELFPDDLDRIEENMMRAVQRVPAAATAGVKKVINGPMIWSPDSAVLFGPERTGLQNDDLVHADTVLSIPLNPHFSSLNMAQAVLLVAYEWSQAGAVPDETLVTNTARTATKEELTNLFQHLERELDESGFLRVPEKRPDMVRNIRAMLQRARPTEQEVNTFHGIIAYLATKKRRD